ncbi:hypothetical protein ACIQMV_18700 [Streptomyces sp. NPDC091412]|uniref:hypothetical protein n=1 Tax=Streptomyces sp. NPDC091412 TaxID=3366002 RepID=UPI00380FD845
MTNRTVPTPSSAEGLLEVPAAALALLALPDLDEVTDGQARGINCIWCKAGPLTAETAVDLGQQKSPSGVSRFPRACRRCICKRVHRAFLDHVHPGPCQECQNSSPGCEIGRAFHRLLREGRRR